MGMLPRDQGGGAGGFASTGRLADAPQGSEDMGRKLGESLAGARQESSRRVRAN